MAKYKTKPFTIEAVRFTGDNAEEIEQFTGQEHFGPVDEADREFSGDPEFVAQVFDKLHSTWVGVKAGQWIIRGNKGEYYPCDPEVFDAKYEPVEEARTVEAPAEATQSKQSVQSSLDSIMRGAEWVSSGGPVVTSDEAIGKYPKHGR